MSLGYITYDKLIISKTFNKTENGNKCKCPECEKCDNTKENKQDENTCLYDLNNLYAT